MFPKKGNEIKKSRHKHKICKFIRMFTIFSYVEKIVLKRKQMSSIYFKNEKISIPRKFHTSVSDWLLRSKRAHIRALSKEKKRYGMIPMISNPRAKRMNSLLLQNFLRTYLLCYWVFRFQDLRFWYLEHIWKIKNTSPPLFFEHFRKRM